MKFIKNSLEWNQIESKLKNQARDLNHSKDIVKMINNIRIDIKKLSCAEILSRQGKRRPAEELLVKINQDIEMVEEYILVAVLMG
jgi:hypothetical protein